MFEIGWTEMLVIAVVMIVVVGPKDLPRMLRAFGKTVAKLRAMAGDFQKQFNDAMKEAELDDIKKSVDALRSLDPTTEIRKQLNPFEQAAADVRSGLDSLKPSAPPVVEATSHAAEPLKSGPAGLPEQAASDTRVQSTGQAAVTSATKAAEATVKGARKKPAKSETVKAAAKPKAAPKPAAASKKSAGSKK